MLIQNRDQFEKARTVLLDAEVIAIDTETTKTQVWTERYLIGFATHCTIRGMDDRISFYFPFRHNHDRTLFGADDNLPIGYLRDLAPVLERNDVAWIMHNAGFDRNIFRKERISLDGYFWDTQLMAHLIDENHYSYDLDNLAKIYLGEHKLNKPLNKIEKDLHGWDKIPPTVMGKYAEVDCELTYGLWEEFLPELEAQELTQLYQDKIEKYSRVLADVSWNGILLDRKRAHEFSQNALSRMQEIQESLKFDPGKSGQLAHILFASPSEGGLGVPEKYGRGVRKTAEFPYGLPTMNEDTLQLISLEYPLTSPVIEQVIEYRKLQKANSTWYQGFQELAGSDDLLHAGLKQHGTKTGRLSSSKPNLQQIPRDVDKSPVKKLFTTPDDYELWEFDYSQGELRLAACYAECVKMKEAYAQGADLHKITAEAAGAYEICPTPEIARYTGKEGNFLLIYLGGAERLQAQFWTNGRLRLPLSFCEQLKDSFHELYPEIRKTAYRAQTVAEQRGYVSMWNGRRRHLPWKTEADKAWNSIIQGGLGQIVMESMIMLSEDKQFTSKMCNQVHDSIWVYLPKDRVEEQKELIIRTMEWPGSQFDIPFPVEAKCLAS